VEGCAGADFQSRAPRHAVLFPAMNLIEKRIFLRLSGKNAKIN
jgi:hypothetical protein